MRKYLYQLQLCHYDGRQFWQIHRQPSQGQPVLTARLRRLRWLTWVLVICGLGLPWLCLARTMILANWLLRPWERAVQQRFLRQAQRKLAQMPGLIKIGITGSYGKTSVKNILAAMLATHYRVVASPASFNTPMGFARTVNETLRPDTQVLIMEMGARQPGDIEVMCALVQPDHGIITSIGPCHLQTFGSLPAIAQTKAELFRALPVDGMAVTDGDNPWCAQLQHPNLTLVRGPGHYQTPLLGQHHQKNIMMAAVIARGLGISEPEIRAVVANLTPTPHRLQKLVAPNGIIILDDSYNANPQSATSALQVLAGFPGRKVVQTPGLVEQGVNRVAAHLQLCAQIKTVADAVIVVGALNRADFVQGLAGWSGVVHYVANRDAAKPLYAQLLRAGDVLLLLNDLPENYN